MAKTWRPGCSPPSGACTCSTATGGVPRASWTSCCATATCSSPARGRTGPVAAPGRRPRGAAPAAREVKTRRGCGSGSPHEAVDPVRLERLHRLVWRWAEEHGLHPEQVRVDLVAVLRPRRGAAVLEHVEGLA